MNKRLITKRQEQALNLCHHTMGALTQEEAAKIMGISHQAISLLLEQVKKAVPQFFPIVTRHEAKIYHYYMVEGWSIREIAEYLKISERTVYFALQRAKKKGMFFPPAVGRIKYIEELGEEDVDFNTKYKF